MLIYDNLKGFSITQPDKICLINASTQVTYGELAGAVDFIACRMANSAKPGAKVLIKLSDPVSQIVYLLGIAKLGAASVLVDPAVPERRCKELQETAGAVFYVDDRFSLPGDTVQSLPMVQPEDLFLGALSSGSTGDPKIIWRDHRSWVSAFPAQSRVFGVSGTDILFLTGSLSYTANLNSCLHILYEGGTVVIAKNSFPRTWFEEITRYKVTSVFMVPANYRTLLKKVKSPLTQVKSLVSAGSKLDIDTVKRLIKCFPEAEICEYYGASELGHISYSRTKDLFNRPDSVGRVFPGVKLWIKDDLIWVKSPYIAPAYQPEATAGDMGRLDKAGYLYLAGRKNNVINKGGIKIVPEYVEEILNRCPGIAETVVKGIDDGMRGQKVAAWIVKSDPELTVKDIRTYCHRNLPRHARPQKFFFIRELPRNLNGKLDRDKLII